MPCVPYLSSKSHATRAMLRRVHSQDTIGRAATKKRDYNPHGVEGNKATVLQRLQGLVMCVLLNTWMRYLMY